VTAISSMARVDEPWRRGDEMIFRLERDDQKVRQGVAPEVPRKLLLTANPFFASRQSFGVSYGDERGAVAQKMVIRLRSRLIRTAKEAAVRSGNDTRRTSEESTFRERTIARGKVFAIESERCEYPRVRRAHTAPRHDEAFQRRNPIWLSPRKADGTPSNVKGVAEQAADSRRD